MCSSTRNTYVDVAVHSKFYEVKHEFSQDVQPCGGLGSTNFYRVGTCLTIHSHPCNAVALCVPHLCPCVAPAPRLTSRPHDLYLEMGF